MQNQPQEPQEDEREHVRTEPPFAPLLHADNRKPLTPEGQEDPQQVSATVARKAEAHADDLAATPDSVQGQVAGREVTARRVPAGEVAGQATVIVALVVPVPFPSAYETLQNAINAHWLVNSVAGDNRHEPVPVMPHDQQCPILVAPAPKPMHKRAADSNQAVHKAPLAAAERGATGPADSNLQQDRAKDQPVQEREPRQAEMEAAEPDRFQAIIAAPADLQTRGVRLIQRTNGVPNAPEALKKPRVAWRNPVNAQPQRQRLNELLDRLNVGQITTNMLKRN